MLCAAGKAVRSWLGDDLLWRDVSFQVQASPARPLAAHLQQFTSWAAARKHHLRCLTFFVSSGPGFNWFYNCLEPAEWDALLALLRTLGGARQLAELQLLVYALPPSGDTRKPTDLPASVLQLPALEVLTLGVPLTALAGPLTHLGRLHTLHLDGVELPPTIILPGSLTELTGSSSYYSDDDLADAITRLPLKGAPGLRSLTVHGTDDPINKRPLFLDNLRQLTALTSLSIDGIELRISKEEEEDSADEDAAAADAQLQPTPALREMACLRALERLVLDSVTGIAIEGKPLSPPRWPALKVRPRLLRSLR